MRLAQTLQPCLGGYVIIEMGESPMVVLLAELPVGRNFLRSRDDGEVNPKGLGTFMVLKENDLKGKNMWVYWYIFEYIT